MKQDQSTLGNLEYGTVIKGVPSHPSIIYTKVDKRKLGSGIKLTWPKHHCVLFNRSQGTLRSVHASTIVTVLRGHLQTYPAKHIGEYLRQPYAQNGSGTPFPDNVSCRCESRPWDYITRELSESHLDNIKVPISEVEVEFNFAFDDSVQCPPQPPKPPPTHPLYPRFIQFLINNNCYHLYHNKFTESGNDKSTFFKTVDPLDWLVSSFKWSYDDTSRPNWPELNKGWKVVVKSKERKPLTRVVETNITFDMINKREKPMVTKEDARKLIEKRFKQHQLQWVEWATNPDNARYQLSVWSNTNVGSFLEAGYKYFDEDGADIRNGCFMCALTDELFDGKCEACLKYISTLGISCNMFGSKYSNFERVNNTIDYPLRLELAVEILKSMQSVDSILSSFIEHSPLYKKEPQYFEVQTPISGDGNILFNGNKQCLKIKRKLPSVVVSISSSGFEEHKGKFVWISCKRKELVNGDTAYFTDMLDYDFSDEDNICKILNNKKVVYVEMDENIESDIDHYDYWYKLVRRESVTNTKL